MLRPTASLSVALATGALLISVAGPASARSPGANGTQTFFEDATSMWHGASPLRDPGNDIEGLGDCTGPEKVDNTAVLPKGGGTTWSPDGATLFVVGDQACYGVGLVRVSPADGTVRKIAAADAGTRPSVSPDGRQVAVTQDGDVHVVSSITGAQVRNLTPGLSSTVERDPSWDPKGKGIAYTASDGIRIRPATGGASRLWKKGVHQPDYSPDGTKIAYLTSTGVLQYADTATGATVVSTGLRVVDHLEAGDGQFTWSPDGRNFLFDGTRGCAVATSTTGKVTSRPLGDGTACLDLSWRRA